MVRLRPHLLALLPWALLLATGCTGSETDSRPPAPAAAASTAPEAWTESEVARLESRAIVSLSEPPPQPSNRVADDRSAAELGHRIFFAPRLSRNGQVLCSTCHVPELLFTDGRATSRGVAETSRNAPTLVGVAWSPWMFWDGRRDSLWAQALGPFEAAAEMGSTRVEVVRRVATAPELATLYARVFGAVSSLDDVERFPERAGPFGSPDERVAWQRMAARDRRAVDAAFANVGKAISAYERMLLPGPSRFDRYVAGLRGASPVDANATLTDEEVRGLRLFVDAGRTLCLRCHNGPLLTNQSFHQVGTATGTGGLPDFGRFLGIQAVLVDPFNCRGEFSDANPRQCSELRFLDKTHVAGEVGKFKTPTLRGLPRTGPYMHDGRFATLEEVIEHYRHPPASNASPEITPLELDDEEGRALVAFLAALDGGVATAEPWLRAPPKLP